MKNVPHLLSRASLLLCLGLFATAEASRADTTITNTTTTETYTTANHASKNLGNIGANGTGTLDLVSTSNTNFSDSSTAFNASNGGAETIDLTNSGSGTFTFNLGTIGRTAPSTINFEESTTGGAVSLTSSTQIAHGTGAGSSNVAGNDLTFWAFYNGNDWAATPVGGGTIGSAAAMYNDGGHDTSATNLTTWSSNAYEDYIDDTTTAYSGTMTGAAQKRGIRFANSAGANLNLGGFTLTTAALLDAQGAGAVTIGNGTITVNGLTTSMVINQNNLANNMTITAKIIDNSGGDPLQKVGVGTLILNPSGTGDTYTGATYVAQGTLQNDGILNGTSSVILEQGATLAGTGKITTPGAVTVNGTLAPGDVTGTPTPGTLTFALSGSNKLTFASGSTLAFDINGASSATVAFSTLGNWLSGSADAVLALNVTNAVANHPYVVFSDDNTAGFTFANITGIPLGDTAVFTYAGPTGGSFGSVYADDYVLVLPEPKAWTMMLIGCTLLTGLTVRRARKARF